MKTKGGPRVGQCDFRVFSCDFVVRELRSAKCEVIPEMRETPSGIKLATPQLFFGLVIVFR